MSERPLYIALEGLKGCGKSTLIDALTRELQTRGVAFELLCPTRPMPADAPLEQRLRARGEQDDALVAGVYAARSNYHASRLEARRSQLILGDRSIFTSFASRWHLRRPERPAYYLEAVRSREHRIAYPDHVLHLRVPLATLDRRLRARTERSYGKRDECLERLAMVERAYDDLQASSASLGLPSRWHNVDASPSPSLVAGACGQHILDLLRGRPLTDAR